MPHDSATLDTIAHCLDYLTRVSGLSAAECLATLEEYSQPLDPEERTRILVWFDLGVRAGGTLH